MPILGKEEPASIKGQFSNNSAGAGIPIKKRRFPMFPPSPPRQESPSPVKDDPTVSNSAETDNAVRNTLLEVKKEVVDPNSKLISTFGSCSNLNVSVAKLNEPNNTTTAQPNVIAMNVANMGRNVTSSLVSLKCKPEPVTSTDALGSKETLIPALTGQNKEAGQPTLFLSLSKENCVDRSKTADETVNNDTVVSLNRANWDLNTTMDDWYGSSGDAPNLDTVGFNGSSKIDLGKQIVGSGECRRDFSASSLPSTQCKAEDLLNLSLSPSFTGINFNTNLSGSSSNMSFASSSMPFASSTVLASGSFSKLNSALTANIPSSSLYNIASSSLSRLASGLSSSISPGSLSNLPSASSANIPCSLSDNMPSGSSPRVSSIMAVECSTLLEQVPKAAATSTIVKKELVEGCTVPNAISKNVVENRPIKSEPVQDINKVTPRFTDSMMNSLARTVLHSQEHAFLTTKTASMLEISSSGLPSSSSSGLSSNSDVSNQEHSVKTAGTTLLEKSPSNVTEVQNSCEKNNISKHMADKDSSGSGCESEGRVKKRACGGKEDEDYEDGEVREFLLQSAALKILTKGKEDISVDCGGEAENSNLSSLGLIDNANLNQDPVEGKDCEDVISEDHSKECIDNDPEDRNDQILDEIQAESPITLVRDKFQDQSFRGPRMRFARGRGRSYNRFDRSEWKISDRKFNSENYNGSSEYKFSRNRQSSAGNEEFESDGYQEGNLVASVRGGGRKSVSDDFPSFHNHNMRRVPPKGRGGSPSTGGIQMVRRVSRIFSHNGDNKYNRSFPEDDEPLFTCYQNSNDGADDQFPQNNRKFSFVQRRGIHPRIGSKSPLRTRMQSPPGPWSSHPRRRSPDSYNRLSRQQRSPPMYRMERVRSPPLNFPDDVVSRRRCSPPYISRPINDFQRPIPNRRSPSDRPLPRNNRRFDNSSDLSERTNGGKFCDGPMRASRFDNIDEEGIGGDDSRRMNERRGGRSFSGENFRFRRQENGGPRPFLFSPKSDLEFVERHNNNNSNSNNLRDREFERRIKNRFVIAPNRRVRAGGDDEGDFRQGGPVWQDESFSVDYRGGKRRRF